MVLKHGEGAAGTLPIAPQGGATTVAANAVVSTVPVPALACPATQATPEAASSSGQASSSSKATVLERHGYSLGKTIGSGSYATVKLARSEKHECDVAIKIVSKFHAPSDYLKRFLPREIDVVKGLKHPNLIRFLQAIETTHRVYIVMEFAPNGSLLDIIRRDSYIDETRSRRWFNQLLNAVDYCHSKGVVHRDIKCENLLMDAAMNIKLSDFGFARGHMKGRNGSLGPLSETYCGSYAYAAPEILLGIPYHPQHTDVWSMGVVLYAMVFGKLPYDDTNYKQLLKQVQSKLVFPREPRVSAGVKNLITRILAPERSRLKIPAIRSDSWLNVEESGGASTSSLRDTSAVVVRDRAGSNDPEPIELVTKEALEAASRIPPRAATSDDEEPIASLRPPSADSVDPAN